MFRLRDDIHRRLPLPRPWKRLLRACARDAESAHRQSFAEQAIVYELRQLTPAVVEQLRRSSQQPGLFGGPDLVASTLACTPIDHAAIQEAAVVTERDRDVAIYQAIGHALAGLLESQLREVHVHTALEATPNESREIVARAETAIRAADVPLLVANALEGKAPPKAQLPPLDLDEDLRRKK